MLKRFRYQFVVFLAIVGPGLITANVDNDSGGIYTYSQAGAKWGYLPLWTLIPITLLLIVTQEMCSRMGAVTGKGLSDLIREEFGLRTTVFLMAALVLVNYTNVVSEFAGIASSLELFHISRYISVPVCAVAVWYLVVRGTYRSVEKIFLVSCTIYVTYIISGILVKPDWGQAMIYSVKPVLIFEPAYITMIVAMVGTSIAPWMQFYLQAAIVEKGITAKEYGCDLVAWPERYQRRRRRRDGAEAVRKICVLPLQRGPFQRVIFRRMHPAVVHRLLGLRGLGIRIGREQALQRSARVLLALHHPHRGRRRCDSDPRIRSGENDPVFPGH
jgi:Mn2+/Fe2+ NRAMP family transporter